MSRSPRRSDRVRSPIASALLACVFFVAGCAGGGSAVEAPAPGEVVAARPTLILDGDSLRARIDGVERELRIWGIDAPERDQPGAAQARAALRERLEDRTVAAEVVVVDDYDRLVVRLRGAGGDVGAAQIAAGHAWWFRRYARDHGPYRDAEAAARTARRGLWAAAEPEAPWDFRERTRED